MHCDYAIYLHNIGATYSTKGDYGKAL